MDIWDWLQIIAVFALIILLIVDGRLLLRMWNVPSKLGADTRKRAATRLTFWAVLLAILGAVSLAI